jgi:hypothetical protein
MKKPKMLQAKPTPTHTTRGSMLAHALSIHPQTVKAWCHRPGHPAKVPGKGWDIEECRAWYIARRVIKPGNTGVESIDAAAERKLRAEADKESARARILKSKADQQDGKLLDADDVTTIVTDIVADVVSQLRAVVEPHGCLPQVDNVLSGFAKAPWLSESLKKKMLALGADSRRALSEHFSRPLDSAALAGHSKT